MEALSSGCIWYSFQIKVGFGRDKKLSINQLSRVILSYARTHNPQNFHFNASAALTHLSKTLVANCVGAGLVLKINTYILYKGGCVVNLDIKFLFKLATS